MPTRINGQDCALLVVKTLQMDDMALLRLLQLADSALPIGAAAHSFGLETLVVTEAITVADLELFFRDLLAETGALEAAGCRAAHGLATAADFTACWIALNDQLSARKPAREIRAASATLGRRFLRLAADLTDLPFLSVALLAAKEAGADTHHCAAFGLAGSALGLDADTTALAYLQQSLTGFVSACQRLMPLGQQGASRLLWQLQSGVAEAARSADLDTAFTFTPLPDVAAMRHPTLPTRLFVS